MDCNGLGREERAELLNSPGRNTHVISASFRPDCSLIVTVRSVMTARVWDAKLRCRGPHTRGHVGAVVSASFSPDQSRIMTASSR